MYYPFFRMTLLPTSFDTNAFVLFGLLLLIGLMAGGLARRTNFLPSITGFMIVGFLIGPGGIGKTRLAAEATRRVHRAEPDRPVYWARVQMTRAIQQWEARFPITAAQRAGLVEAFDQASRGSAGRDLIVLEPGQTWSGTWGIRPSGRR